MKEAKIIPMKKLWIYKLDSPYGFPYIPQLEGIDLTHRWITIHPMGNLIVNKGFAWDGCTPKWSVLDIVVGTPDGVPHQVTRKPKTWRGSLAHDALYQFAPRGSITRKQADRIFYDLLRQDGFRLAGVYYRIVRLFGWYWWNRKRRRA